MITGNNLNNIELSINGHQLSLSLAHLENLEVQFSDFRFESGIINDVTVRVRPTNHVYSRRFESDTDNYDVLKKVENY
ncbi:conserved protein of unknown function [Shewanella benthica]|uniref:Uncharacterized protein n=1 Tax=Shewanella benthica TaxID=43661 RepID=A0A330LXM0_9GAMM|nr:hypothetical protein [Shewanella benthica]SQH74204.1 conserved protein of unknown function [Shewanella benthica]